MRRDQSSLAALVAEGLGKMLMHNCVWAETGLGSLEQGDTVKVHDQAQVVHCAHTFVVRTRSLLWLRLPATDVQYH